MFLISSLPLKNPHDPFGSLPPEKRSHSSRMTSASNLCPERTFGCNYIPNPPFAFPNTALIPTHSKVQYPRSNNEHKISFYPIWTQQFPRFPSPKRNHSYNMNVCLLCTWTNPDSEHNPNNCLSKRFHQCCFTKLASSTNRMCE